MPTPIKRARTQMTKCRSNSITYCNTASVFGCSFLAEQPLSFRKAPPSGCACEEDEDEDEDEDKQEKKMSFVHTVPTLSSSSSKATPLTCGNRPKKHIFSLYRFSGYLSIENLLNQENSIWEVTKSERWCRRAVWATGLLFCIQQTTARFSAHACSFSSASAVCSSYTQARQVPEDVSSLQERTLPYGEGEREEPAELAANAASDAASDFEPTF